MTKLEMSARLQRKIRQDSLAELGIPTWTLAEQALREGKIAEGLELMDYARQEVNMHGGFEFTALALTYLAEKLGEEEVERIWSYLLSKLPISFQGYTMEEKLQHTAELFRGHSGGRTGMGDLALVEEPDRYVMTHDPCGTGGRLRRFGAFAGLPVGTTKKSNPWSWGKAGVSYYCVHCCLLWEIGPIKSQGYPERIHENVDKPGAPCVQLFYKSPELIPEHYFTRVGTKKDASRFARCA